MEILFWVGAGILIVVGGIILGVTVLVKLARGTNPAQQPAVSPVQPRTFKEALIPYAPWFVGVGIILALLIVYLVYTHSSSFDWKLWIAGTLVIGGAAYGLRYSGQGSKWLTRIVAASALAVLAGYAYYGDKAPEVAVKMQERNFERFQTPVEEGGRSSVGKGTGRSEKKAYVTNRKIEITWATNGPQETIPQGVWSNPLPTKEGCVYNMPNGISGEYDYKLCVKCNLNDPEVEGKRTIFVRMNIVGASNFQVEEKCS